MLAFGCFLFKEGYSKYPTKDKIVCQTGQYEWFFVKSVEFCKLNKTQGPEGPTGQQGPIDPKRHKESVYNVQLVLMALGSIGPAWANGTFADVITYKLVGRQRPLHLGPVDKLQHVVLLEIKILEE